MEHQIGRLWFEVTGDSYVVNVKEVSSAGSVASYVAKYVAKDFLVDAGRKKLGFARAWSRSRNWPVSNLQLLATKEKRWFRVQFSATEGHEKKWDLDWWLERTAGFKDTIMQRTGTDLSLWFGKRNERRAVRKMMKDAEAQITYV